MKFLVFICVFLVGDLLGEAHNIDITNYADDTTPHASDIEERQLSKDEVHLVTPSLKWDYLSVTYKKYNPLPMNKTAAIAEGWELLEDNCEDQTGPFRGIRYTFNGDRSTILIFDSLGDIAGHQVGNLTSYPGTRTIQRGKYAAAFKQDGKYTYITAYYMDPKMVCDADMYADVRKVEDKTVMGDRLVFLIGPDKYLKAPMKESEIGSTLFRPGKCVDGMGFHYWYDIKKDMDCDDEFPAFVLYDNYCQLYAWGFSASYFVNSTKVEHPPKYSYPLLFREETQPACLQTLEEKPSSQHVFFTKVTPETHICDPARSSRCES